MTKMKGIQLNKLVIPTLEEEHIYQKNCEKNRRKK